MICLHLFDANGKWEIGVSLALLSCWWHILNLWKYRSTACQNFFFPSFLFNLSKPVRMFFCSAFFGAALSESLVICRLREPALCAETGSSNSSNYRYEYRDCSIALFLECHVLFMHQKPCNTVQKEWWNNNCFRINSQLNPIAIFCSWTEINAVQSISIR